MNLVQIRNVDSDLILFETDAYSAQLVSVTKDYSLVLIDGKLFRVMEEVKLQITTPNPLGEVSTVENVQLAMTF